MAMRPKTETGPLGAEVRRFRLFALLFVPTVISGIVTFVLDGQYASWVYITVLLHCITGLVLPWPLFGHFGIHLLRVIGIRHISLLLTGFFLIVCLTGLWLSGLWIVILGVEEDKRWILNAHVWLGFVVICLLPVHVMQVRARHKNKLQRKSAVPVAGIDRGFARSVLLATVGAVFVVLIFSLIYERSDTGVEITKEGTLPEYQYLYGANPFSPSEAAVDGDGFVRETAIANSGRCAVCHADIFTQWSQSAHRRAASDPAYVKNISLLESEKGIAATRYCEACHAPVALLSGQLSAGGSHGGVAGTAAFTEGVGCMACHGVQRMQHLEGNGSYRFDPAAGYLFAQSESTISRLLYNFLVKVRPAEHRELFAREISTRSESCAACHEQFMEPSMNDWGWVKMQSVYSNWLDSPYSHRSERALKLEQAVLCQDCHFPLVEAQDPSRNKHGKVRAHFTPGANTMLPTIYGDQQQLDLTMAFLQSGKVTVTIDRPGRSQRTTSALFLDEPSRPGIADAGELYSYPGERVDFRVSVSNRGVGHSFPAGTNDINQAWLHVVVIDAALNNVFESGALDEAGFVDADAHFYRSIPIDRQGRRLWKHDLFRMTGVSYANTIRAGSTDVVNYTFTVPAWAQGPLRIFARIRYRKFNRQYENWVFDEISRPEMPIVEMARDSISIPLRPKPPLESLQ